MLGVRDSVVKKTDTILFSWSVWEGRGRYSDSRLKDTAKMLKKKKTQQLIHLYLQFEIHAVPGREKSLSI